MKPRTLFIALLALKQVPDNREFKLLLTYIQKEIKNFDNDWTANDVNNFGGQLFYHNVQPDLKRYAECLVYAVERDNNNSNDYKDVNHYLQRSQVPDVNLGMCFENGIGVDKNIERAKILYNRATIECLKYCLSEYELEGKWDTTILQQVLSSKSKSVTN